MPCFAVLCSTAVRVLTARCCGHEGGVKRACKKHKLNTFSLLSSSGEVIGSATHLAGLAHWLRVGGVGGQRGCVRVGVAVGVVHPQQASLQRAVITATRSLCLLLLQAFFHALLWLGSTHSITPLCCCIAVLLKLPLLQVSSAAVLDGASLAPLPDYANLPAAPTWRKAPDASVLTVWLPADTKGLPGNWQTRPCCGLDVYLDKPQTVQAAVG
jgi:hypothetical protein